MQNKWNERYRKLDRLPPVNKTLICFYSLASNKRAIDVACGLGQNALFLAKKGFTVDAIDLSQIALQKMVKDSHIRPILADITQYEFPEKRYGLIFCANFLERSIFDKIKSALAYEGIVIYETFTYKADMNPSFTLKQNELIYLFKDFEILYYELNLWHNFVELNLFKI